MFEKTVVGKARAILFVMLIAPVLLVSGGCANLRLPAIDPSGSRLFLPQPNFTTLARDGFLSRLHGGANGGGLLGNGLGGGTTGFNTGGLGNSTLQQSGPFQPALFNRHREHLSQLFQQSGNGLRNLHGNLHAGTGRLFSGLGGLHQNGLGLFNHKRGSAGANSLFGNSAFSSVGNPPLCGPNGLAPDGSPCYPIGSPSDSSLAMTLPGATNRIGSGLAGCNTGTCAGQLSTAQSGMARFAGLGSGVVLAQPRYTARVGEEVVVLGGVQSTSGIVRGGEPVKWSLSNDSVGTIIDAASGAQPRRLLGFLHRTSARNNSASGCGSCVQSVTSERCRVLPRNAANPQDDIYLSKGQSWASITSGSPGRSFVTLAAPQLNSGRRAATAIIDWTDSTWECPKPVISSLEGPANLITRVFRNSDQRPLSNWLVRYTYVDGPKVTFNDGTDTADIPTDANGRAILEVNPTSTEPGTTRVAVQIYDPDLPAAPVSQCVGFVTWSESEPAGTPLVFPEPPATQPPPAVTVGPPEYGTPPATTEPFIPPRTEPEVPPRQQPPQTTQLAINVVGQETASIGSRVRYDVEVTNTGNAVANDVQIWTREPSSDSDPSQKGARLVDSEPRVYDGGTVWGWDLGDIAPRDTKRIATLYEMIEPGEIDNVFNAKGQNTSKVQDKATTGITGDVLRVEVSRPNPFQPVVGQGFSHGVRIQNRSSRPQDVVLVVKDWTDGIRPVVPPGQKPPTSAAGVEQLVTAQPGVSQWFQLDFEAGSPGSKRFAVTAALPNSDAEPATAEGFVNVQAPQQPRNNTPPPSGEADGRLEVEFPETMRPGDRERVFINLTNTGTTELTNIRVVYNGDPDLRPVNGTAGFRPEEQNGRQVLVWEIVRMPPEYFQAIEVVVEAARNPSRRSAGNLIQVISDQGRLEKPIEVELQQGNSAPFGSRGGLRIRQAGLRSTTRSNSPQTTSTRRALTSPSDSPLAATIETRPTNVQPGEPFEFVVTVSNRHASGFRDLALCLNLPEDVEIVDFHGPPMTKTKVSEGGRQLNFGTVREILPLEKLTFRATAVSTHSGDAKTVARVEAAGLVRPVIIDTDYHIR